MKQWHMIKMGKCTIFHQFNWYDFSNNVSGFIGRKWNQCYILYMFLHAVSSFFDDRSEIRVRQSCLNATNLTDLHSFYSTSKLYFIRFHTVSLGPKWSRHTEHDKIMCFGAQLPAQYIRNNRFVAYFSVFRFCFKMKIEYNYYFIKCN